ncbi:hypothetical protein [Nocardioides sp.]|uniref:hypothetical protein n=1 Tax=Nocardioides sp. TaxID=35761 RepID=UPI002ED9B073
MTRITPRLAALVVAAVVVTVAVSWVVGSALASRSEEDRPVALDPAEVAQTTLPDLAPAHGEPELDGLADAAPAAGAVGTVSGPFDDRYSFGRLRLDGAAVTGAVHITSDVSDLLELQVLAGFYDARGRLLATGRATHHLDEDSGHEAHAGPPSELERFRIAAPRRIADRVASAAVGVPVLVNE